MLLKFRFEMDIHVSQLTFRYIAYISIFKGKFIQNWKLAENVLTLKPSKI